MVLIAVDDLLFSSKIRAAAKAAAVDIRFARTAADVLSEARTAAPALIVFDLNSAKVDPVSTIASLKADPALRTIRTIGFVSHVDAATIQAAKRAGADEVLARSTFAAQLGEILLAARGVRH